MTLPTAALDHLVVAADTLEQGSAYVRSCLGAAPAGGGCHVLMGTHNRVLKLGEDRYLEVIAIDPQGRKPDGPRWFDLNNPDLRASLKIRPRLVAWVARTNAIDVLATATFGRGVTVRPMRRDALRWRFAFTPDGALPGGGVIPHMIQWETSRHPAASMAESGCVLEGLDGVHGDPTSVQSVISSMGLDDAITIYPVSEHRLPGLSARIRTPSGLVILN